FWEASPWRGPFHESSRPAHSLFSAKSEIECHNYPKPFSVMREECQARDVTSDSLKNISQLAISQAPLQFAAIPAPKVPVPPAPSGSREAAFCWKHLSGRS